MKKTTLAIVAATLLAGALILVGCNHSGSTSTTETASLKTSEFAVEGMTCSGCEAGIKMAVGRLEGVEDVTASHTEGAAKVSYDPDKTSPDEIIATIDTLGYGASLTSTETGTTP